MMLFDVIYADPPWRYDNATPRGRPDRHYPTMTQDDICALNVPAADDAVLFLWAVSPRLPEALEVLDRWGFRYRSGMVWDKAILGVGYWFRGQHEHLLVGVRGQWSPPSSDLRVSSVYREQRTEHSRKPAAIRTMIATWWPDAKRLEMFCRHPAPGWCSWGNQVLDSSLAGMPAETFDPAALRYPGQAALDFSQEAAL